MREILFRGKTKDGKWVFGDLVTTQNICISNNWHEVIRVEDETVCQFSGETDEHGVKIFEHDLCYYFDSNCDEDDGALEIIYKEGGFWVKGDGWTFPLCEVNPALCIEVIGNIYDNPELLGGAK